MGVSASLNGSQGYSTSTNSAQAANWSNAQNSSHTYGTAATQASITAANVANEAQLQAFREAQEFNAREAAKARKWQEQMANSVYQRTVKDMIAAGINPVLAAGAGLGTASVGSGTSASISAPSMAMAQAYPDTVSSGSSASEGYSHSQGSSYSEQEAGLATALTQMAALIGDWVNTKNTASTVEVVLNGLQGTAADIGDTVKEWLVNNLPEGIPEKLGITSDQSSKTQSVGRKKVVTGKTTVQGREKPSSGGGRKF